MDFFINHLPLTMTLCFLFGIVCGCFIRYQQLKQKEKELTEAIESLYSRNIDRKIREMKDKEFEETKAGNEDRN